MAEPKDSSSFFRKVVKFVANPATEWADLDAPPEEVRGTEYAKVELKAMIERKRRNDFVRKRELDMLRNVRREGLSGDQLSALAGSSRLDDSEPRITDTGVRQDIGVKAKIDEIEQQMVGDNFQSPGRRGPETHVGYTEPARLDKRPAVAQPSAGRSATLPENPPLRTPAPARPPTPITTALTRPVATPTATPTAIPTATPTAKAAAMPGARSTATAPGTSPIAPVAPSRVEALPMLEFESEAETLPGPLPMALTAVAHDPDLDEAVIAFANADFEECEHALLTLTGPGGRRAQHTETWLAVFDLYRAIGQQIKFESLALDYAQQFGQSAPQWFSMPRLVAEAASEVRPNASRVEGQIGWVCPEHLDIEGISQLASQTLQMPLPWVFEWNALQRIDVEACARLSEVFRSWIPQDIDMRWLNGERLFAVLQESAPTGARDADPAYWQLRLDALRMTNRPDQFDEAAIDYCVTYEVSPPSWEAARCEVRVSGAESNTTQQPLSLVSDVSTNFEDSESSEDSGPVQVDSVELSGQLVGDIAHTLGKVDAELGSAALIQISCARLIRVDFIAAGDLLNWVLARRAQNRSVTFSDAHRLVALFFGAMGINEHATVKVRTV